MNVKMLLVTLFTISCLFVSGCKHKVDNIEVVTYDDYVLKVESTKEYVIVLGSKGIYVLDGKYQVLGKTGTAGMLLGYTKLYLFDISEALRKHPELVSDRTSQSASKQSKLIEKWKKDNEQRKTPRTNEQEKAIKGTAEQLPARVGREVGCALQQYQPPNSYQVHTGRAQPDLA